MQIQWNEAHTAKSYGDVFHQRSRALATVAGICAVVMALWISTPAYSQSQPGRLLVTPRPDIILEGNSNGSNFFHVVGASQASGDPGGGDQLGSSATQPSIANNGTIAFQARYGPDGGCVIGAQAICWPHVFLMDPDGTNVRQITFANGDPNVGADNAASISPDGTTVAFISNRNAFPDANNNPVYLYEIYLVNTDGSNLREVTFPVYGQAGSPQAGNPYGDVQSVAWSPDSKQLAFKGHAYGPYCGTSFGFYNSCGVVGTINADGTALTYLAGFIYDENSSAFAIDWSPDGTLIAYAHDSLHWGEPTIGIIDRSGQGRYASVCGQDGGGSPAWWGGKCGLSTAQLGVQYNNSGYAYGQFCPTDVHGFHFSPDSAQLAYENYYPQDNTPFSGISTINLDGTGRDDGINFGIKLENGIWWTPGPALPAAAQITLAPNTFEVWPGFSQQLTPTLLSASNDLILHAAQAYHINYVSYHNCGIQIGPYGLVMYSSFIPGWYDGSSVSAENEGLISNSVVFKCWPSPPCTYSLGASSENFPPTGGAGSVTVTSDPGSNQSTCPWNASSNAPWIEIISATGSGNGSVSFTVMANAGSARQGTMTIAGATFTVSQDAAGTVVLQSISVSPATASVPAGLTQQFTATGHYSDGSTKDLTTSVTWSSSNTGIATISNTAGNQGLARGIAAGGPVTITATLGAISGTAQVTVTAPVLMSLGVSPINPSVPAGNTQQLTATGTYSDGSAQNISSSVTWASSNTAVATISASGLASALTGGTTTISANQGSISNSTTMTVITLQSLTISPVNPSIFVGATLQFAATGHYSDGSTRDLTSTAAWSSSKTSVATITSGGFATGMAKGSTTIKAAAGTFSATMTLKVNAVVLQSITVTPASATISVGGTQQFTATATYSNGSTSDVTTTATWSSSPKQVASLSSTGLATGLKAGTATISAKSGGITISATLTIR